MDIEEQIQLLIKYTMNLENRIDASQMALQLVTLQLHGIDTEKAQQLALNFENISNTSEFDISQEAREYLQLIARSLKGDENAELIGMSQSEPPPESPRHWFKGVINGGKK